MGNLFGNDKKKSSMGNEKISFVLADRMRPRSLDEIIGQDDILGAGKPLRRMIESDDITSLILWGPPGSGKTTIAHIIAKMTGMDFLSHSAVLSSIGEIKKIFAQAERNLYLYGRRSILFIDEIHRFNKAQQDAFLPYVEKGTIILIGATTENPSFEVISPLLSRVQVFVLNPLEPKHIREIIIRALTDEERGLGRDKNHIEDDALELISNVSSGDARFALNIVELADKMAGEKKITVETITEILQRERILYDRTGEEHYNIISALHKSIRDSDPDGALYWLARMLEGGEDRRYILRRLIRMAIEDVGLADPNALLIAVAGQQAFDFIGYPEGDLALAEVAVYLAYAPKSNSIYTALHKALADVKKFGSLPVPMHIRNAPTKLMKKLGYGRNYKYAHDFDEHITAQKHLPEKIDGHKYYEPTSLGFEEKVKRRFEEIRKKLRDREKQSE
ncbi:replication-associated recombination protein A [bacterium]|nr:replication-associated recombination protein A [bacterium]